MEVTDRSLIEIKDLTVECFAGSGDARIGLRCVSLAICQGEFNVFAGETGSGISLLARLIAGAAGPQVRFLGGTIHFEGRDLLRMKARDLTALRRGPIGVISGDPAGLLNPDRTVRQWLRDYGRRGGGSRRVFPERRSGAIIFTASV